MTSCDEIRRFDANNAREAEHPIGSPRPPVAPAVSTRAAVIVLAVAGFVGQTASLLPAGMLPQIAAGLRVSLAAAGALTAIFALAIVLTVVPLTRWTLRLAGRDLVLVTVVVVAAGNLTVCLAPVLPVALVGRFVTGAAHGLLWAALPVVVAGLTEPMARARAMSIVLGGSSAGMALGAPMSTLLSSALGWRPTFAVVAAAGLLTAFAVWRLIPRVPAPPARPLSLWSAARLPGVLLLSGTWALVLVGHYGVLTYIAPYSVRLGVDATTVSALLSVLGFAAVGGVTLAGRVRRRSHLVGAAASAGLMVVAFVALWAVPDHTPIVVVLLVFALWGAGQAASLLFNQQAVLLVGHRAPATASSLAILITQLGVAVGAFIGGAVVDGPGVRWVPAVGIVSAAAAAALTATGRGSFGRALRQDGDRRPKVS